jgi:hypothetical protein
MKKLGGRDVVGRALLHTDGWAVSREADFAAMPEAPVVSPGQHEAECLMRSFGAVALRRIYEDGTPTTVVMAPARKHGVATLKVPRAPGTNAEIVEFWRRVGPTATPHELAVDVELLVKLLLGRAQALAERTAHDENEILRQAVARFVEAVRSMDAEYPVRLMQLARRVAP